MRLARMISFSRSSNLSRPIARRYHCIASEPGVMSFVDAAYRLTP